MISNNDIAALDGATVYDTSDKKIGKIGQVYLNDETGEPEFVTVHTGMFGSKESFVPTANATFDGDKVMVPYDKDTITGAPNFDADAHLDSAQEQDLHSYYGMSYAGGSYETTRAYTGTEPQSGTDDAMTLSEEHLRVGTETVETGKVRLRKYIVTEMVTKTVPVSHEEVRLEREPITDANRDKAMAGEPIRESEHEITLHEQRPIVTTETVPVEQVRLVTDTVTGEEEVTGQVRKEQIDLDDAAVHDDSHL
jgi:uncharacterized protein (TIGR02271 family)